MLWIVTQSFIGPFSYDIDMAIAFEFLVDKLLDLREALDTKNHLATRLRILLFWLLVSL